MLSKEVLTDIGFSFQASSDDPSQFIWRRGPLASSVQFICEDFAVLDAAQHAKTLGPLCRCDNCSKVHTADMVKEVVDLAERVDAGSVVPAGECQSCGALCYLMAGSDAQGEPSPWDEFQQVVVESYNGGDHQAEHPDNVHNIGDTLLTFLLVELSKKEDCDSMQTAIDRLDSAMTQLQAVRDAFEAKALA